METISMAGNSCALEEWRRADQSCLNVDLPSGLPELADLRVLLVHIYMYTCTCMYMHHVHWQELLC